MSATLNGWQTVAVLLIGALCVAGGVLLGPGGTPLVGLGSSIVGACLGILQPWRSPQTRTRRSDTLSGTTPPPQLVAPAWDPDRTPPPASSGPGERRRRG